MLMSAPVFAGFAKCKKPETEINEEFLSWD